MGCGSSCAADGPSSGRYRTSARRSEGESFRSVSPVSQSCGTFVTRSPTNMSFSSEQNHIQSPFHATTSPSGFGAGESAFANAVDSNHVTTDKNTSLSVTDCDEELEALAPMTPPMTHSINARSPGGCGNNGEGCDFLPPAILVRSKSIPNGIGDEHPCVPTLATFEPTTPLGPTSPLSQVSVREQMGGSTSTPIGLGSEPGSLNTQDPSKFFGSTTTVPFAEGPTSPDARSLEASASPNGRSSFLKPSSRSTSRLSNLPRQKYPLSPEAQPAANYPLAMVRSFNTGSAFMTPPTQKLSPGPGHASAQEMPLSPHQRHEGNANCCNNLDEDPEELEWSEDESFDGRTTVEPGPTADAVRQTWNALRAKASLAFGGGDGMEEVHTNFLLRCRRHCPEEILEAIDEQAELCPNSLKQRVKLWLEWTIRPVPRKRKNQKLGQQQSETAQMKADVSSSANQQLRVVPKFAFSEPNQAGGGEEEAGEGLQKRSPAPKEEALPLRTSHLLQLPDNQKWPAKELALVDNRSGQSTLTASTDHGGD